MRKGFLVTALVFLVASCGARPAAENTRPLPAAAAPPRMIKVEAPYLPVPGPPSFVVGYTPGGQAVSLGAAQTPLLVVKLTDPETPGRLRMVAGEEQALLARHPGPPLIVVVEGVGFAVTQAVYRLQDLVASLNLVLPVVVRAGAESPAPELAYESRGELREIAGWPDAAALAKAQGEVVKGETAAFGVPIGRARHR